MGHWFKHDSDASSDLKLKALKAEMGFEGVGMWWAFLEILSSQKDCRFNKKFLSAVVSDFNVSQEKLNEFLKLCYTFELLTADDSYIYSESLIKRLEEYESKKEKTKERVAKHRETKINIVTDEECNTNVTKLNACYASSSSSLSSSNSESNNKNSEFVEVMHGRQCLEGNVWLSEEETELAKMRLSQNGLEHSDFEEAVRTLSDYLRGENNRFSKDKHFSLLVGKININSLLANKRQKDLNKRTKDPPVNKITFTELEKQARDKEEEERAKRVQALMIRKQKELAGNASH